VGLQVGSVISLPKEGLLADVARSTLEETIAAAHRDGFGLKLSQGGRGLSFTLRCERSTYFGRRGPADGGSGGASSTSGAVNSKTSRPEAPGHVELQAGASMGAVVRAIREASAALNLICLI
jgi:hypothetical protein